MQHQFTYEISDELIRRSTRVFFLQLLRGRLLVFGAFLLLVVWICISDDSGRVCGVFGGLAVLLAALLAVAYFARVRRVLATARKLGTRNAGCWISDEGIRLENALATSSLKWGIFDKVVCTPDIWLLFVGKHQYFPLPSDRLEGEIGRFIAERIAASGGRVTGNR
jgi:YcxB-like protein